MRLTFEGVFAEARALWEAEGDTLLRVAGFFGFLPLLAAGLFMAPLPANASDAQAGLWLVDTMLPWLFGTSVICTYASLALLLLLLDPGPSTGGRLLVRALALLPFAILAMVVVNVLVWIGLLLIVPGLYVSGRAFLTLPTLAAGPSRNPLQAIADAINRSTGNGWFLALIGLMPLLASYLGMAVLRELLGMFGESSDAIQAIVALLAASLGTAALIATALLQVAAYRLLSPKQGPRQGM
ncbi:hypothetical protein [Sphingomonas sp.]|uniref:hypothetical protein n=1 Tax=Sphingomonas sp. TaxID=28214 RepID=UPI001B27ADB9|nr:hypothetical protein [Sphingomonas sp.]MBO9713643.1 hypothetical protein [Sphingomonas sp.]